MPDVLSLWCFILPCRKKNKARVAQVTDVFIHTHGPFTSVLLEYFLFQGPNSQLDFSTAPNSQHQKANVHSQQSFFFFTRIAKFFPERISDSFCCSAYKSCVDSTIWIDAVTPSRVSKSFPLVRKCRRTASFLVPRRQGNALWRAGWGLVAWQWVSLLSSTKSS